jgi:hypothetical protein
MRVNEFIAIRETRIPTGRPQTRIRTLQTRLTR